MDITQPEFIPVPWAINGQKASIPEEQTSAGNGRASWKTGFPLENTVPVSNGGVPANYQDFQGVLYTLSENACYQQAGGMFTWSNTIDYQNGARVLGSDGKAYIATGKNGPSTTVVNPVGDTSGKWLLDANMNQVSSAASVITQGYVTSGGYTVSGDVTYGGNVTVSGTVNGGGVVHLVGNETISGTKTFTNTISGTITNATSAGQATKLTTARTVQTDLGATTSASFDGTANITPGVTGTLAVANGGTGVTTIADIKAGKDGAGNTITDTYVTQTEYDAAIENLDETKAGKDTVAVNTKNIANIESLLNGALSTHQTDATSAYTKTVPVGAQPYATIDAVGGKTVCWNQMINEIYALSSSGVTITKGNNGYAKLNGTTTSASYITAYNSIILGHKYIIMSSTPLPENVSWGSVYMEDRRDIGYIFSNMSSPGQGICFTQGAVFDNWETYFSLVDLTVLYGAGNEPTTVAEFKARYSASHYPYDAGSLKSAAVTGAVSESKNLLKNTSASDWSAWSSNIAWNNGVITDTILSAGTGPFFNTTFIDVVVGDTFTISAQWSVPSPVPRTIVKAYDENGNALSSGISSGNYNSYYGGFVITSDTLSFEITSASVHKIIAGFVAGADTEHPAGSTVTVQNFQLERGSTATAYTPYRAPATLPIPSAVQQLPGYGWSAGGVYNEVDWVAKKYIQRVGSVDLGTLEFQKQDTTAGHWRFISGLPNAKTLSSASELSNMICTKYPAGTPNSTYSGITSISFNNNTATKLMVNDESYSDVAAFTTAMSGVMLYYELATPVITDISSLLSDDNLLAVEPGGTLTFPNALGDDYRLPVPSDVEYTIDLAPDAPSTDGTYTLQCVVADGVPTYSWVSA